MEFINFTPEWFLKKQNKKKKPTTTKNKKKTKKKKQQKLTLSSKQGNLQSSILFILSTAQLLRRQESYKISAILIRSVVKINFNVILHSFVDVIGALYVVLNQRLHAVFIWSVDMCFIFVN